MVNTFFIEIYEHQKIKRKIAQWLYINQNFTE